jgi:hypothetical protein
MKPQESSVCLAISMDGEVSKPTLVSDEEATTDAEAARLFLLPTSRPFAKLFSPRAARAIDQ